MAPSRPVARQPMSRRRQSVRITSGSSARTGDRACACTVTLGTTTGGPREYGARGATSGLRPSTCGHGTDDEAVGAQSGSAAARAAVQLTRHRPRGCAAAPSSGETCAGQPRRRGQRHPRSSPRTPPARSRPPAGPAGRRPSRAAPGRAMVSTTAPATAPPPTSIPAIAPASVSRRHQMPSTSSGQNVDAATAKASPTARATPSPRRETASSSGTIDRRRPPARLEGARRRGTVGPARPGRARRPPRSISPDDVDRNAANAPATSSAASSSPPMPPTIRAGSSSTTVSAAPEPAGPGVDPAERAVHRRQQVEQPEQGQHDERRPTGGRGRRGWCRSGPRRAAGPSCRGTSPRSASTSPYRSGARSRSPAAGAHVPGTPAGRDRRVGGRRAPSPCQDRQQERSPGRAARSA